MTEGEVEGEEKGVTEEEGEEEMVTEEEGEEEMVEGGVVGGGVLSVIVILLVSRPLDGLLDGLAVGVCRASSKRPWTDKYCPV